ncbi:hypothetical protein DL89DRAFT_18392 [Linderina pennispora]|uniref:Uncharacterized protein n=1 Tax=Linderina pennispora TaxID=61395 RepID=A0A1Y1WLZ9_9FUNG|nr:uncharacterized protein DL89DRAFT_18392 [Linderina pennispora]ORX74522.1 hypothetical protein DL89DRAFT_18392 [Linderina pennispora]
MFSGPATLLLLIRPIQQSTARRPHIHRARHQRNERIECVPSSMNGCQSRTRQPSFASSMGGTCVACFWNHHPTYRWFASSSMFGSIMRCSRTNGNGTIAPVSHCCVSQNEAAACRSIFRRGRSLPFSQYVTF